MVYKIVQWATGGIGRAAIEGIIDHPDLALVGCWVHSANKVGKDAGTIAGVGKTGVIATNNIEDILALDADCLIYAPVFPVNEEIIRFLEAGINVVTPTGWFYPEGTIDTKPYQAACKKGDSVLHGTGIHPGGFTERFPLHLSAMQHATTHVRSEEWSDIRTYDAPEVVGEMMMFGKTPEGIAKSMMGKFLSLGFYQSIRMVATELKMRIDDLKLVHEYALATQDISSPIGVIKPGHVAAQRFTWQAITNGKPVIEAIVNWYMGSEGFDKPWSWGKEGPRYEVEVKGDPDIKAVYHGVHPTSIEKGLQRNPGVVATAMHCVNSVPAVCSASAGIRTYLDLPLMGGRASPELLEKG